LLTATRGDEFSSLLLYAYKMGSNEKRWRLHMTTKKGLRTSIGLSVIISLTAPAMAKMPMHAQCTGVLTREDSDFSLAGDFTGFGPINNVWCNAQFSHEINLKAHKAISNSNCLAGDKCQVTGIINGHGVFYWIKVNSAKKVP
jgi:hypothetical protein